MSPGVPDGRPAIVACGVFEPALRHLGCAGRGGRTVFLPPHLHLRPRDLEAALRRALEAAHEPGRRLLCLYGSCAPGLDEICRAWGAERPPFGHCYEAFLGPERYRAIVDRTPGTFFLVRDLLLDFERSCVQPLELDDPEVRRHLFEHYRQLCYIVQPGDGDWQGLARDIASFLDLELLTVEADYASLAAWLAGHGAGGKGGQGGKRT